MKVTIDTNIIVQDFWLDSPHSKVFLEELNLIPASLYIPEVVIDESINKYREFISEKIRDSNKLHTELSRLLKKEIKIDTIIDINKATKNYEKFLKSKLKEINAEILPYPKIEHKNVVKSILERRRPFKNGDSGYRDFLIWQTIKKLELWGTEEIVFLTNNIKDFGSGGFLSEEFTDKTTGNKNFKILVSISKFNDEYIIPRLNKIDELKNQLSKGQVQNFNFKNWLDTEFLPFLKQTELEEIITGFPYGVGNVRITEVLLYDDFKIKEVSELDSGERFISFSIKCKVNASIDISWEDYAKYQEVRDFYGVIDKEFGNQYGMTTAKIEVEGYFILDKLNQDINSFEVTMIEGPNGSIDSYGT